MPRSARCCSVGPQEPVAYRRVRLRCGERVLSEADNWYVPALLTPDMNRTLDTTDTSFGRVVAPLDFRRETLSAKLLWSPESRGAGSPIALPRFVLQHRAVLERPDGRPFSALVETYTSEVLGPPAPALIDRRSSEIAHDNRPEAGPPHTEVLPARSTG